MKIDVRLARILREHNLQRHGVITEISKKLNTHRQTIARLVHGEAESVSLTVLGDLCEWLIDHGVPPGDLPMKLIGPSELWDRVVRSKYVMYHLGEKILDDMPPTHRAQFPANRWVSRDDVEVATDLVGKLTEYKRRREIEAVFCPFHIQKGESPSLRDRVRAQQLVENMRAHKGDTAVILIGSQKVSVVVEYSMAAIFGCTPCDSSSKNRCVPFHLVYRDTDPDVVSCFGGRERPTGLKGKFGPGIYYRDDDDGWQYLPWSKEGEACTAGIVVTSVEEDLGFVEVALIGYSGRATSVLGYHFLREATHFWPPVAEIGRRRVGVFACRITNHENGNKGSVCEVTPLSAKAILSACGPAKGKRKKRS